MKSSIFVLFFTLGFESFLIAQLTDNTKREGDLTDPAINPIYEYYEWENSPPEAAEIEVFESEKE